MQDIIVALQWTKENIAAFGGDPSRVTIVGQGTGAALANLILVAKDAKGESRIWCENKFPSTLLALRFCLQV